MGNDTTHNLAPIAAALANRLDRVVPVNIADRFQLLHGPYRSPQTRPGRKLFCEIRGTVTVAGFGDGPIPWPTAKWPNSRPAILCGDLVKAVRRKSQQVKGEVVILA